jgi:hypothetical protein
VVKIAITLPEGGREPRGASWRAAIDSAIPCRPANEWQFLGYDVADEGLLSSIMNCGYLDAEALARARALWSPHINSDHLFAEFSAASDFGAQADHRIIEHAPFFVFGLWRIEA